MWVFRPRSRATAGGQAAATTVGAVKVGGRGAVDEQKPSASTRPELIYFDGAGRGQLTRLAFAAGCIDFTDTRIAMGDYPAIKNDPQSIPSQCFGSLPCIKHGDKIIAQSRATAIYAAQQGIWAQGRLGSNDAERAANGAMDIMGLGAHADVQAAMYKCLIGDDASKAEGMEELPEQVESPLSGLERMYERKQCPGSFLVCEWGPTLTDLAVYDMIESPFPGLKALGIDMTQYPKLCAARDAVCKDPDVATYFLRASMGKPELVYFAAPGRGQLTRLAFAAGDVDFVDTRLEMNDWPDIKNDPESIPSRCFGSVPCIKHGDLLLAQSEATVTYAAQLGIWKHDGRLGSNASEQAINRATEFMVLGAHADLQTAMYKCLIGDDESMAEGKEALSAIATKTLDGLERVLGRKTCTGPFFFSESGPTLADLAVYDVIESPSPGLRTLNFDVKPYPKLCAVAAGVVKDARIKRNFKP